jgi:EthD domain
MYKVIHLVKRKSHLTHEEFREHFERSHAPMAQKYCGHLFRAYRRNYVKTVLAGGDSREASTNFGPKEWEWDLLSEWIMPDEKSFHEITRIMQSPGIRQRFEQDEDQFIDRQAMVMMSCTGYPLGAGSGHQQGG